MTAFDLNESFARAEARFAKVSPATTSRRRRRSDAGRSRMAAPVAKWLTRRLAGQERPRMADLLRNLEAFCTKGGHRRPSRATVYKFLLVARSPRYIASELPDSVRSTLYNLGDDARVAGPQLVFYCFHYGGLREMSFAAGLPWLALYQASRMRGWRKKSLGVLQAVMRVRRI
jgi:hypothetical protein